MIHYNQYLCSDCGGKYVHSPNFYDLARMTYCICKNKKEGKNIMKKEDLRTGMCIIFENGMIAKVHLGTRAGNIIVFYLTKKGYRYFTDLPTNLNDWSISEGIGHVIQVFEPKNLDKYNNNPIHLYEQDRDVYWEAKKTHTIELDGVKKTISDESYNNLKELFSGEQK